jgi:uncharacterized protein YegL
MPKLQGLSVDDVNKTVHGFQYTNVSIEKLGASEYTIVQMVSDQSGSVSAFKAALENMLQVSVDACKKSPRAENLLYRTTAFNSKFGGQSCVDELHGFSLLSSLNPDQFKGALSPNGGTPLNDATMEAVEALYDYGKKLYKQKYTCNAILFILTDGEENASTKILDAAEIKKTINMIISESIVESLRTILIGVNDQDPRLKADLEKFRLTAGLDEYVSIGEASAGKLAKLAQFVSQSVSSQSQALGSGAGSQLISFKF